LGDWVIDRTRCGLEDTRGVHVDARSISFYEAKGAVRSAFEGAKGAAFQGEGRSWEEQVRLRPLPQGRLELLALGRTEVLERCPPVIGR
jgi:hypothetical protein